MLGSASPGPRQAAAAGGREQTLPAAPPPKTTVKPLIWRCYPCSQGKHPGSSQARGACGHRPNTPCALASFLCFSSPFFTSPSPPEPHPFPPSGALENPFLPVNCSAQHPWEGMWGHPSTLQGEHSPSDEQAQTLSPYKESPAQEQKHYNTLINQNPAPPGLPRAAQGVQGAWLSPMGLVQDVLEMQ